MTAAIFPPYEAVAVIRQQTLQQHPEVAEAIAELGGKISDQEMQKLNYALAGQRRDVKEVAQEFLRSKELNPLILYGSRLDQQFTAQRQHRVSLKQ